jgi:uncharacterized protein (DUF1800 family)
MGKNSTSSEAKILHVLNRLSFGPRPGDIENVKSKGIEAYIESQLSPGSIAESAIVKQQLSSLETLRSTPMELRAETRRINREMRMAALKRGEAILQQAIQGRAVRSIYSPRQLQEVLVDFWFNHFNVSFKKGLVRVWAGVYEEQAIRPHVLGKFRQLLGATAKHPAMLFYLDNWVNTAPDLPKIRPPFKGLNENYARELLELHTLGVDGGYTQQDVMALARILTGWGIQPLNFKPTGNSQDVTDRQGFLFESKRHDFSDKVFLGKTIKGSGIAEGEQVLDLLARHPSTARHLSYKLAQYFVADRPPASLVDKLAKSFLESEGDLRVVMKTLFAAGEFSDPQYYNAKFKTPYQYLVSGIRATDIPVNNQINSWLRIRAILNDLGMPIYGCISPDGYKNTEEAWLNPDAMLRRISLAKSLAGGLFAKAKPVDVQQLRQTLGDNFSAQTKQVIADSPPKLQAALILGSPELMKR